MILKRSLPRSIDKCLNYREYRVIIYIYQHLKLTLEYACQRYYTSGSMIEIVYDVKSIAFFNVNMITRGQGESLDFYKYIYMYS